MGDDCYFFEFWKLEDKYEALKSRADALEKALDEIANDELRGNGSHKRDIARAALEEYRG